MTKGNYTRRVNTWALFLERGWDLCLMNPKGFLIAVPLARPYSCRLWGV